MMGETEGVERLPAIITEGWNTVEAYLEFAYRVKIDDSDGICIRYVFSEIAFQSFIPLR